MTTQHSSSTTYNRLTKPTITLSAYVHGMLQLAYSYASDQGIEMSFVGVSDEDDPLHIVDLLVPIQECSGATTDFDDSGYANALAEAMERGYHISQCWHWIHFHPGTSVSPSGTDWSTFNTSFGNSSRASMIIMAGKNTIGAHVRARSDLGPVSMEASVRCLTAESDDLLQISQDLPNFVKLFQDRVTKRAYSNIHTGTGKSDSIYVKDPNTGRYVTSESLRGGTASTTPNLGKAQPLTIPLDDDDVVALSGLAGDPTYDKLLWEAVVEENEDPQRLISQARACWAQFASGSISDSGLKYFTNKYKNLGLSSQYLMDTVVNNCSNGTYDCFESILDLMQRGQFLFTDEPNEPAAADDPTVDEIILIDNEDDVPGILDERNIFAH